MHVKIAVHMMPPFLVLFFPDNIESNVEVAAVRVESGNAQLESAVRHKV